MHNFGRLEIIYSSPGQYLIALELCVFFVLLLANTVIIKSVFHWVTGFITQGPLNNNFKTHCIYHSN
jgi:hypothetical protein